jgi:hypothetical protein
MFSTLSHIFISMHCNHCWSFKHALNIIPSKNLTYFNKTPIIQHKASILKEFYAMPPDSLLTELHDSLTRFLREHPQENQDYNVKSPCATVEPLPPTLHRRWLLRRKPLRKPQPCPPKYRRRRSKGRPDQGLIETCLSLHCCH